MAKRKEKKEETPSNFEAQEISLEDFEKIIKVVENSEVAYFGYDGKEVSVDYSKLLSKTNNLKILNKKGEVLKSINYKEKIIKIYGNKFDCLELLSLKKWFYIPITKSDGNIFILTTGK